MSAQQEAKDRAEAREDYYVRYGFVDTGVKFEGPFDQADADDLVNRIFLLPGVTVKVLKVVEDYDV